MKADSLTLTKVLLCGVAVSVLSSTAQADEFHYRDVLIGDRAAGLAGAYTAISDDAAGLYYNPAGVVYSAAPKISGSVNAYNYKSTTYKGITAANPDQKWTRVSSGMIANYFGVVQPMGDASIGFSIAIPNSELEDQSDSFKNLQASQRLINGVSYTGGGTFNANATNAVSRQEIDYNNSDSTTLAGVSYATPVTKTLSIGITLYGYMRKKEMSMNQISIIQGTNSAGSASPGAATVKDSYYQKVQTQEYGLQPRLGVMWAPAPKWSVGMMVQSTLMLSEKPEYRIDDSLCSTDGCFKYNSITDSYTEMTNADFTNADIGLHKGTKNDLPVETNLGVAYFASDALLYSLDVSYASKTSTYEQTLNAAAGVGYYLNPTWALRGGLYTNNANTSSNVAATGADHVDLFGGSISLARYTKSSNITLGLNYSQGSGKANLFKGSSTVQSIAVNSLNMFISTSASF